MKVLFLDFDGVLNSDWWFEYADKNGKINPKCENTLDEMRQMLCHWNIFALRIILDAIPDLKIVISSTWRNAFKMEEIKQVLSEHSIDPERIVGMTPRKMSSTREQEIWMWVDEHKDDFDPPGKWLALDDWDLGETMKEHAIQTCPRNGLVYLDAMRAIYFFKPTHFAEHHGKYLKL